MLSLTVATTVSPLPLELTVIASVHPLDGADRFVVVGTAIAY